MEILSGIVIFVIQSFNFLFFMRIFQNNKIGITLITKGYNRNSNRPTFLTFLTFLTFHTPPLTRFWVAAMLCGTTSAFVFLVFVFFHFFFLSQIVFFADVMIIGRTLRRLWFTGAFLV